MIKKTITRITEWIKGFNKDNEGIGVVEIILILVEKN